MALGERDRRAAHKDQPESDYRDTEERRGRKGKEDVGRNGVPVLMTEALKRANAQYDHQGAGNTLIGRIGLPREKMTESHITNDALRELDRLAGKPFFLTVSLPAPHAPWEVGEPYYSLYPARRHWAPRQPEALSRRTAPPRRGDSASCSVTMGCANGYGVYRGLVSMVDWNVGRLLDALRARNLERDTLVILTADHGDMQGGHGCYDKTTFSIYEETSRIPLIIRWPGRVPAGKQVHTHAGSCTFSPPFWTISASSPAAPIHGTSLRPFVEGREDPERPIFCERERGANHFQRMIRTHEWKYCYASTGASQLYNLEKDPGETRNLLQEPLRPRHPRQTARPPRPMDARDWGPAPHGVMK